MPKCDQRSIDNGIVHWIFISPTEQLEPNFKRLPLALASLYEPHFTIPATYHNINHMSLSVLYESYHMCRIVLNILFPYTIARLDVAILEESAMEKTMNSLARPVHGPRRRNERGLSLFGWNHMSRCHDVTTPHHIRSGGLHHREALAVPRFRIHV